MVSIFPKSELYFSIAVATNIGAEPDKIFASFGNFSLLSTTTKSGCFGSCIWLDIDASFLYLTVKDGSSYKIVPIPVIIAQFVALSF